MESQRREHHWKDTAHEEFERWADHYDRDVIQILLFEPCYRRVLGQLRHWRRRGIDIDTMLDVGCGTGTLAGLCLKLGHVRHVTGLDMSDNMISRAREKTDRFNLFQAMKFQVGDAEHLPFDDNSFNLVTCCNSFHHYPHQHQALAEMYRVLKPGGYVMILDGYRDNLFGWLIFDVAVATAEKHVHHCSRARFASLLQQAGFVSLEQHVFGVCPPVLVTIGRK